MADDRVPPSARIPTMMSHSKFTPFLLCLLVTSAVPTSGFAQQPTYWQDVRPVFRKHCTVCHSAKNLKEVDVSGGLALDSYEAVLKGSTQPVVRPGQAADSRLVKLLVAKDKSRRMPLDAPPLPDETIALVKKWIDAGAPEGTRPADTPDPVAKKAGPARKLDILLPTTTVPPAGALG